MQIDFVVTWVDNNDPKWLEDFRKAKNIDGDSRESRYRDWGTLKYLFRGFEKFTPWVNKIYFVTYGHLPDWLDIEHPKLVIVNHEDFMLKENLPVFNINPIEINFHNIKGLSEHFVYFNDDTFITAPIGKERFFRKGLPVNSAISHIMHVGEIAHIVVNDLAVLNRHFDKREVIFSNPSKWFNFGYGLQIWRTLLLLPFKPFTGFYNYHHPQPFLKSTYIEVWEKEPELMKQVSSSKFRSSQDVNQYLFKYWQFATGKFSPSSYKQDYKKSKYIEVSNYEDAQEVAKDLLSGKYSLYCPNDDLVNVNEEEYVKSKKVVIDAFDKILPKKSEFEINIKEKNA
jgi:hypothetical protein